MFIVGLVSDVSESRFSNAPQGVFAMGAFLVVCLRYNHRKCVIFRLLDKTSSLLQRHDLLKSEKIFLAFRFI